MYARILTADDAGDGGLAEAENVILAVIVGCEIGFWVLLLLGLLARYALRLRRLGGALLLCVPLVDVVLLVAVVIDLRAGGTASWSHGLAAAYIAYSVVFGHRTLRWADQVAAHRLSGGPPPWKPPAGGMARARYEWGIWLRVVLAYGIACGLLWITIEVIGDPARTGELSAFMLGLGKVPAIAVLWPLSYTLFPKKVGTR
ncbi:hypothetical protein [Sphaerisporangium fuscum]|uniref:hypothetical protein n=1 Tax=Sphaerisporangium fuscum TaxID=2835868 RepID=UPI0027E28658|nr:hypothetical protein [Sphaerisporangium fuscum]